MSVALFLYCIGTSLVPCLPQLPDSSVLWLFLVAPLLCALAPRTFPLLGLVGGFAHGCLVGQTWLENKIPYDLEGRALFLEVQIKSAVSQVGDFYQFQAIVQSELLTERYVQLLWLEAEPPSAGETWYLPVKLFRPRGTVNPGLFDYEAWLLSESVNGVGYVLPEKSTQRIQVANSRYILEGFRESIQQHLNETVEDQQIRGALSALVIGESGQMSRDTWQALSRTGTNHLFVVSGLHIGLVALVLVFCFQFFSAGRGLTITFTCVGLVFYSQVVGFGLPVQRALLMFLVATLFVLGKRAISPRRILLVALASVLAINPFATLTMGFWLSFGAVFGLMLAFSGTQRGMEPGWQIALKTQWVAMIVTAPLLLGWLGQVPMVSVVVNIVLIPFIGFVIVPLILVYLVAVLSGIGVVRDLLLTCLTELMSLALRVIDLAATQGWLLQPPSLSDSELTLVILGGGVLLMPRGIVPRWYAVFCWVPLFNPSALNTETDYMRVDVLDVGQGLSVLVTGPDSTLLYDAGPKFTRRDAGEQIVLPALKFVNRRWIDVMITSHGDDDHAGGVDSVRKVLPIQRMISSDHRYGRDCNEGEVILPDFKVTWFALSYESSKRNNLSCVVIIHSKFGRVLLPGDIEEQSEYAQLAKIESARLLISPHHGSQSSSTPAFINAVSPSWVVHSSGYLNRFGHPHTDVYRRYENRGIRQLNTASSGAVGFLFSSSRVEISEARKSNPRFWYDAPLFSP